MALKPCRECKSMVSNKAKICPNCGIKTPIKSRVNWVWIAFGVVILFIIFNPKNESPVNNVSSMSAIPIKGAQPNIEKAIKQVDAAMKDPRKVRLMECMGVDPWKVKPTGWKTPTEDECNQLKIVLGKEADEREASQVKNEE